MQAMTASNDAYNVHMAMAATLRLLHVLRGGIDYASLLVVRHEPSHSRADAV